MIRLYCLGNDGPCHFSIFEIVICSLCATNQFRYFLARPFCACRIINTKIIRPGEKTLFCQINLLSIDSFYRTKPQLCRLHRFCCLAFRKGHITNAIHCLSCIRSCHTACTCFHADGSTGSRTVDILNGRGGVGNFQQSQNFPVFCPIPQSRIFIRL